MNNEQHRRFQGKIHWFCAAPRKITRNDSSDDPAGIEHIRQQGSELSAGSSYGALHQGPINPSRCVISTRQNIERKET